MANILDGYRDILEKKAFAHLATLRPDGSPHVTPVWVDFDGTHEDAHEMLWFEAWVMSNEA